MTTTPQKKTIRVRPVPAVSRSIAILRLLGKAEHPMGVKAIADELDLVPSTCLHILRVLVGEELVEVDSDTKRYALGSGMVSLARSVLERGNFAERVQPALDRLASSFGVTAMGVEVTAKETVVVVAISRSDQPFRLHTDVGSQFTTLVSATGRVVAAYSGASWDELRSKFEAIAWDKRPTFPTWKEEVERVREQGWSVDRDNFMMGITVVAVPVFSPVGRLSHTLVAAGLSSQFDDDFTTKLAEAMRHEANQITANRNG